MYMMYICSMFQSCFCNCAVFVCSLHVEEINNNIIIIITYINPAIHAPGVYTSQGVISFYLFKMGGGGTLKKVFSETMTLAACSPINSANLASWV